MKGIFKSIAVAFSMYSKIPMPRFNWAGNDMKYHLIFFPWIGAVIGVVEYSWFYLYKNLNITPVLFYLSAIVIPLIVTGGFHVDGFMDTMDARHSYQSIEKKLEILKDPHIGAFAVINVIIFFLIACGCAFQIKRECSVTVICFSFAISRALSGISVISFPKAKKDGMIATESDTSCKKLTMGFLVLQLIILASVLIFATYRESFCGAVSLFAVATVFIWYYFMSKRNFGGITGDLAGYFVCIAELVSLVSTAVCEIAGV